MGIGLFFCVFLTQYRLVHHSGTACELVQAAQDLERGITRLCAQDIAQGVHGSSNRHWNGNTNFETVLVELFVCRSDAAGRPS